LKVTLSSVTPENGAELSRKKWQIFQPSAFTSRAITSYTSPYPKSQNPMNVVIWHLPVSAAAEDYSDGLVNLGFDVISVKQMSTTRRSPAEGTTTVNIPLCLITLPRASKSQEIFKLTSLCHVAIRVEAHKAQTGSTQCYNCQ
jgi:hypothetical protein